MEGKRHEDDPGAPLRRREDKLEEIISELAEINESNVNLRKDLERRARIQRLLALAAIAFLTLTNAYAIKLTYDVGTRGRWELCEAENDSRRNIRQFIARVAPALSDQVNDDFSPTYCPRP